MEEVNVPSGFAFIPTDVELVEDYLIPKLKGQKLPSDCIVDLDSDYKYDPYHLPYNKSKHVRENEAYFFTSNDLRKYSADEEGYIRATRGGHWEVYRDVVVYCAGKVIGFKTKLFFHNNNVNGSLTSWKMNQFRCHPSRVPTTTHTTENYIICKIKHKEKKKKKEEEEEEVETFVEVISEDEHDTNGGNF